MNYWLNLFTGTTWQEFQTAGANVTGFREHNWKRASKVTSGDVFLCYLTGVKLWVGLLEVTSSRFRDESLIWGEEKFPVRFQVKPLILLKPEHGVPMDVLKGKLSFYKQDTAPGKWSGWVRSSPTRYDSSDGQVIAEEIRIANANPVVRLVDPKKLSRSSNLYKFKKKSDGKHIETVVSVPTVEEDEAELATVTKETVTHSEIQWRLLDLGAKMGFNTWAPRSDRGKQFNGNTIHDIPTLLEALPTQFDAITNQTVENIDVLWLNGNAIIAAFEVEHSTSIYSGLLRMSDLLTMQPNLNIKLYLTAPDERFTKFKREVPRATFASLSKPLHTVCAFLPYSTLCDRLEAAKSFLHHLKPEFLDEIAEFYDPADEFDA